MQVLRQRVEPVADRFDFYASCGHFERRVQETGARRAQMSKQKSNFRKCAQCVPKSNQPQMTSSSTMTIQRF